MKAGQLCAENVRRQQVLYPVVDTVLVIFSAATVTKDGGKAALVLFDQKMAVRCTFNGVQPEEARDFVCNFMFFGTYQDHGTTKSFGL
uniref:Uncharacterized protein n=1 Tax=Romanomermis culicivorax TaxID=13658 RepID=A0A915IF77_ROMCU